MDVHNQQEELFSKDTLDSIETVCYVENVRPYHTNTIQINAGHSAPGWI